MTVAAALNIEDLRRLARARLPQMVFDYIDGGADDEVTLRANVERLRAWRLQHRALVDIAAIDLSATVMGARTRLPFFISPTAASRLFHYRGERAVAAAANEAGVAYGLSTIGSTSIEEVAGLCHTPKLFQVYVWKDRGLVREVLARAKDAGFIGAVLTVDVPVAGNRERDPRNGFSIPPKINWKTATQALAKPDYLFRLMTNPPVGPENFKHLKTGEGGIVEFINSQFDRTVTWKDAEWMRDVWGGPFALKGIAHADDARRCAQMGAAVWVSNHGGRQLDTAPATIDTLGPIVEAVQGAAEVIFDGGVRRGHDIAKALALGATSVAIGRAYLYGLAAGGQEGVARAIAILETELRRTMAMAGAPDVSRLTRDLVLAPA
jgi:L-lactate dehydrogenase (cytochrome)